MIIDERDYREEVVKDIAKKMMIAARTAPKTRGNDLVEIKLVDGEDIKHISDAMFDLSKNGGLHFLERDAENILKAQCILLVGVREQTMALNCGYCGSNTCADKPLNIPCTMNAIDVGIALGSACATASDLRVDTRIMYSVGSVVLKMGIMGKDCRMVYAIPISASSKNPFFDRVVKK